MCANQTIWNRSKCLWTAVNVYLCDAPNISRSSIQHQITVLKWNECLAQINEGELKSERCNMYIVQIIKFYEPLDFLFLGGGQLSRILATIANTHFLFKAYHKTPFIGMYIIYRWRYRFLHVFSVDVLTLGGGGGVQSGRVKNSARKKSVRSSPDRKLLAAARISASMHILPAAEHGVHKFGGMYFWGIAACSRF